MVMANPVQQEHFWLDDAVAGRRERLRRHQHRSLKKQEQSVQVRRLVLVSIVVVLMAFGLGVRHASLSAMGYELVAMKTELSQLEDRYSRLQAEASRLSAPGRVEETAILVLGMTRPVEIRTAVRPDALPVVEAGAAALAANHGADVATVALPSIEPQTGVENIPVSVSWLDRAADWFYEWLAGASAEAGNF
ncbi:MAG: hypothetical protein WD535_01190 [Thermaerobacterales bacterium]